jgi:hypothetical protein
MLEELIMSSKYFMENRLFAEKSPVRTEMERQELVNSVIHYLQITGQRTASLNSDCPSKWY